MNKVVILTLVLLLSLVWTATPTKAFTLKEGSNQVTDMGSLDTSASTELNTKKDYNVSTGVSGGKVTVPVEIKADRELNQQEINEIEKAVREVIERNQRVVERNSFVVERMPNGSVSVRVNTRTKASIVNILHQMGIEADLEELERSGEWKRVVRVENRVVVKMAKVEKNAGAVVAKELTFDETNGIAEARVSVVAESNGVFLVEENLPKGAEIDVNSDYLVLSFDPVIAWAVELNEGETATVNYRVRSTVPPELAPTVSRLAACDVEVEVEKVVEKGNEVSGQFRVLLAGSPVYTKDVRVNGDWTFVKDGMYYLFQGEKPVVIEGKVGDCRFYKEIGGKESDNLQQALVALVVLGLLAAAYILFRP